jgi:hypothetical protein
MGVSNGWKQTSTHEDLHDQSEETIGKLAKYVKVNYFDKGITDEVAIRADLESRAMPVTTVNLTTAIERLKATKPAARQAATLGKPEDSPPGLAD